MANDTPLPASAPARLFFLTLLAMIAFAGNSLLCRAAFRQTTIDAASFTGLRLVSGALALWLILRMRRARATQGGSWLSAAALFGYAAAFSFAYLTLTTATGALLLFGAVQATMILWGLKSGERLRARQWAGLVLAAVGLIVLLLPGLAAPPLVGSFLMLGAGVAWGVYSLRGKFAGDPTANTAGNFARAVPLAALLCLASISSLRVDAAGFTYAVLSGALASGVGYAIWYRALPDLRATSAATVQLAVPVLAAAGGILLLGEPLTWRFLAAASGVLGGIALVVAGKRRAG